MTVEGNGDGEENHEQLAERGQYLLAYNAAIDELNANLFHRVALVRQIGQLRRGIRRLRGGWVSQPDLDAIDALLRKDPETGV